MFRTWEVRLLCTSAAIPKSDRLLSYGYPGKMRSNFTRRCAPDYPEIGNEPIYQPSPNFRDEPISPTTPVASVAE